MIQPSNNIITVDGDTASGKTSVSNCLAQQLGYKHIDSGAIFRSLAFLMNHYGLDLNSMLFRLEEGNIMKDLLFINENVYFKEHDITSDIHNEKSGLRAAAIGNYEPFQSWFVKYLRGLVFTSRSNCIVSGRIGGSIIFPAATCKIYLRSNLDVKQQRRYLQFIGKQPNTSSFEETRNSILFRDNLKSVIPYWNIAVPPDTSFIETSRLSLPEVSRISISTIRKRIVL